MRQRQALPSDAGLSLVEALVAVFIMALATSVIVLTRPPPPDPVDAEVRRFSEMVETLSQHAIATGAPLALDLGEDDYKALKWQDGKWLPYRSNVIALPNGMRFQNSGTGGSDSADEEAWPEIEFTAQGVTTPMQIILRHSGADILLSVRADGQVVRGASDE